MITEVTVRLYGIPAAIWAATCSFPSVEVAVKTVIQIIRAGIAVARIELADAAAMDSIIRYSKLNGLLSRTVRICHTKDVARAGYSDP